MDVEMLIIGNEVLIGKTKDTNSNWMAKRIAKFGHRLRRITTVADELVEISKALKEILERKPDMIITSGGLGPTFDDLTLEGIAKGLGRKIVRNEHAYNMIKKSYENAFKRGILKLEGMTKEREKMAYLPKGAKPLKNLRGTAPGVEINQNGTLIFCLPGVPMEMKGMFNNSILQNLKDTKGKFVEKGFTFKGIGESQIAAYTTKIEKKFPQLWIKTHPRLGEFLAEIELSITAFNIEDGEELVDNALDELREIVLKLKGKIQE